MFPESYFIDESGSSGDLTKTDMQFTFGKQEVFALVAVGLNDAAKLGDKLSELKKTYRVQAGELKSSALLEKPKFVKELMEHLKEQNARVLIEIVDKRFMIVANFVNTIIFPPVPSFDQTPDSFFLKNSTAEYLDNHAPDSVLQAYVQAAAAPSNDSARRVFQEALAWLGPQPRESLGGQISESILNAFEEFDDEAEYNSEAWKTALPPPDNGKRGQPIWILPNMTSLCSLYARINELHKRKVGHLTLMHDEQLQFDGVLEQAKQILEKLGTEQAIPSVNSGDWHFEESAKLRFGRSEDHPGIQAADVIAGFLNRYVRAVISTGKEPSAISRYIFHYIRRETAGINFVLSYANVMRLGVPTGYPQVIK